MRAFRGAWRLGRAVLHAVAGWLILIFRFPRLNPSQREAQVQVWSRQLLQILGVGLQVRGTLPAQGPLLLVSNHISWLDILVLHAARYCRFVSKSDVKHWPLIGTLATRSGTLYIERASRRDAMRVVHQMAQALESGDILAIFPEGTTSDGVSLLPFHANLIQAAVASNTPILPVALQFIDARTGAMNLSPCYVGEDTLMGSVWRTLTGPPITAVVTFGLPEHAQGRDRRTWAADLQQRVAQLRSPGGA